jgi:TRAP-type C4-dicarboxylate transport system substrate-binding protein
MKKFLCILIGAAMVMLTVFLRGEAVSAETINLKAHNMVVETRPIAKYLNEFCQRVSEKTKGTVQIKAFHGGSLGVKDADILRLLKDGFVDVSIVYAGYLSRDAPDLFVCYVDGAISKPEQHLKAFPAIMDTYKKTLEKWDIVYGGFLQEALYDTCLYCKQPVQNLAQLKDKKVRVWSKQQVEALKKMGVAGQIIPQADLYMALSTGVVDCAVYLSGAAPLINLQEVAPNESYLIPYASIPSAIGISQKAWAKLSDEQKAAVKEALDYVGNKSLKEQYDLATDKVKVNEEIQARVKKGFKKLPDFPAQDVKIYVDKSVEAWDEIAKAAGPEALASKKRTLDAIAK